MRLTSLNQLIHAGERFDGVWRLTPAHELEFRRRGTRHAPEDTIILRGELIDADAAGVSWRVTGQSIAQDLIGQTVRLQGRWQADARNRLTLLVEREGGRTDRLTLQGAWALGPHHEIRYRFRRPGRGRPEQTITFSGAWELTARRQLTYVLDVDRESAFRFRGALQTPSILAKEGELRYQLGMEVAGRRRLKTIALFGTWKISRTLGLTFEIPMTDGRLGTMTFGASWAAGPGGTVTASLTARNGDPLGVDVVVAKTFWREQAEAFVRVRRAVDETAVEAGVRGRW